MKNLKYIKEENLLEDQKIDHSWQARTKTIKEKDNTNGFKK